MRLAVRSRYSNLHGGYEEGPLHDGRSSFRKTTGETWIFHQHDISSGRPVSVGPRWHFAPSLPNDHDLGFQTFFSSQDDAATPEGATWPADKVERMWHVATGDQLQVSKLKLFVDKSFPPTLRSLGNIPALKEGKDPEWLPARCLRAGTWDLFQGGIDPNDLLQGSIGNCWLVAAMASLAEFPEAVQALFVQSQLTPTGKCNIWLYDARCTKVNMTIDEYIPCHTREWWDEEGCPLFARPNGNAAWVLLLEKAFAKMLGSYCELSGGNCCMAFRAFTGEKKTFVWSRSEGEEARIEGEWKRMQLAHGEDHFEWTPGMEDRCDAEGLWVKIRGYNSKSFLVACSMRARNGLEHVRVDGLVEAHAYSILQVVEADGHRLVFLRNPWGNDKRWNGRWCDGDEAWARNPSVRRYLRPEFLDDGAFWMAWVDFAMIFDFVFVCARTMRSSSTALDHARQSAQSSVTTVPVQRQHPKRRLAEALPERLPRLPVGSRVALIRQPEQSELSSGRVMEIVGWDEDTGCYEIQGVPSPYWNCPVCGEINKRTRLECNVCSGQRDVVVPSTTDSVRYRARPEDLVLPPETEVEVAGLRYFPELNGQPGVIVTFDRRCGRYHVRLPDAHIRAIRPPHIIARGPPQQETEFSRWTAPVADPSHVDEPESPQEVLCDSDEEVRRVFEELDDELQLKRDLEAPGKHWRLRRGQQLVREGYLLQHGLAELRRAGELCAPLRLRFTRNRPAFLRSGVAGAYFRAVLDFDSALIELVISQNARQKLRPGCFSFVHVAAPGWMGPAVMKAKEKTKAARGSWGGWVCQKCGDVNFLGTDFCPRCDS